MKHSSLEHMKTNFMLFLKEIFNFFWTLVLIEIIFQENKKATGFSPGLEPDFSCMIQLYAECPEAECKLVSTGLSSFTEDGLLALEKSAEPFVIDKTPDSIQFQKVQINR